MVEYVPVGVCSRRIQFAISDDGIVSAVRFEDGCAGNGQGVASLVEGLHIDEVCKRLSGICCGNKTTSCPDQLARALRDYQQQHAECGGKQSS